MLQEDSPYEIVQTNTRQMTVVRRPVGRYICVGVAALLLVAAGATGAVFFLKVHKADSASNDHDNTNNNGPGQAPPSLGGTGIIVPNNNDPDVNDPNAPWNVGPASGDDNNNDNQRNNQGNDGNGNDGNEPTIAPASLEIFDDPSAGNFFDGDLSETQRNEINAETKAHQVDQRFRTFDYSEAEADNQKQLQEELDKGMTDSIQNPPTDAPVRYDPSLFYPEFHEPLVCNRALDTAVCDTPLSVLYDSADSTASTGRPLTIPCGQCYFLDTTDGSTLEFPAGIRVEGKLYSPPTANAVIRTPFMIVFGELQMDEPNPNNQVKVLLYGQDSVVLQQPSSQPNPNACVNAGCDVGSKVIAIAGGTVDIRAYPDECPAWTTLLDAAGTVTTFGATSTNTAGRDGTIRGADGGSDGGTTGPNLIVGGDASTEGSFVGYGNPSALYCQSPETETTDCAHMAYGRNNWPRGLFQELPAQHFDGTGRYKIEFDVKLLNETNLLHDETPAEVPIPCTPAAGNVWCPIVRMQMFKNGNWTWHEYFDIDMDYRMDGQYSHFSVILDAHPDWYDIDVVNLVLAGGPGGSVLVVDNIHFARYISPQAPPSPIDWLVVSTEAAACWNRPGSELVIASSSNDSTGEHVVVIDRVEEATGRLYLRNPLPADTVLSTVANDPEHATEVGLLSRRIVFEAEEDENDPLMGGHMIFYYTRGVRQRLQGVEIRNFGQQGMLGRYPVHFHVCENLDGTLVSKNVV